MTNKIFTGDTAADGAVPVTGGSYGGDAIDLVSITGTGGLTVSSAAGKAARGKSLRITSAADADTALIRYTGFTGEKLAVHFTLNFDALPATNTQVCTLRHASGNNINILLNTNGTVRFQVGSTDLWVTPNGTPLVAGTKYRISIYADRTTNTAKMRIYDDPLSNTAWLSSDNTAMPALTGAFAAAQAGKIGNAVGTLLQAHLDDFRVSDAATDVLPAETANTPPTVNAGVDQTGVEPWSTVTLTASASDPDGTTPTVTWAQTGGSAVTLSGSGATRTFEAPATIAGATLTFTCTATDNSGATASDSMTVTVLPVTERAVIGGVEVPMQIREF